MATEVREVEYAKGWSRLGAAVIDNIITSIPIAALAVLASLALLGGEQEALRNIAAGAARITDFPALVSNARLLAVVLALSSLIAQASYHIGFIASKYQATPGKRLFKLKVANADTLGPVDIRQAARRYVILNLQQVTAVFFTVFLPAGAAYFSDQSPQYQAFMLFLGDYNARAGAVINAANGISILAILWILFDARGQGLHDKFADTVVYKIARSS